MDNLRADIVAGTCLGVLTGQQRVGDVSNSGARLFWRATTFCAEFNV